MYLKHKVTTASVIILESGLSIVHSPTNGSLTLTPFEFLTPRLHLPHPRLFPQVNPQPQLDLLNCLRRGGALLAGTAGGGWVWNDARDIVHLFERIHFRNIV